MHLSSEIYMVAAGGRRHDIKENVIQKNPMQSGNYNYFFENSKNMKPTKKIV